MKTTLMLLLSIVVLCVASACSSGARIGTRHHHVSVGGSVN